MRGHRWALGTHAVGRHKPAAGTPLEPGPAPGNKGLGTARKPRRAQQGDSVGHMAIVALRMVGCDLYTTCEPCALCVAAMFIVGIRKLFYAASLEQSGAAFEGLPVAQRHPIDVDELRAQAGASLEARRLPSEQQMADQAVDILRQWAEPRKATSR